MDIALGVSMTPTTVRMVLVEGEKADGVTVDHDVFDVTATEGTATSSAAEQVIAAVLGTKESADAGGHHLKSIGVTWSDHTDASALRDALAARGIDDVMLVSDGHAAAALAKAVGRAVGYDTTALLFIDRDTATLSVVQTDDGSVVKVLSRTLHSDDAMAVLTEMAAAVDAQDSPPQGMFIVGSGVDVSSVKAHLEHLVSLPVSAPDEPELALARGAALASANAPAFEATTVGLAYSQDPDGTTAGAAYTGLSAAETQLAPVSGADPRAEASSDYAPETGAQPVEEGRKPFLLVGSALTSIFVVGVVALAISLAVSIRPTVDKRPSPGQSAIVPSTVVPAPPPVQEAQPIERRRRHPRRPSRRRCRWYSKPRRRRRGLCTSSSRRRPPLRRHPLRLPRLLQPRRPRLRRRRRWSCLPRHRSCLRRWSGTRGRRTHGIRHGKCRRGPRRSRRGPHPSRHGRHHGSSRRKKCRRSRRSRRSRSSRSGRSGRAVVARGQMVRAREAPVISDPVAQVGPSPEVAAAPGVPAGPEGRPAAEARGTASSSSAASPTCTRKNAQILAVLH